MKNYLFISDLDGTLLNEKSEFTRKTIKYIKKFVNDGHYFVLNTGRPYQGTKKHFDKLEIDCPFICDNGASIYWEGKEGFPKFNSIDLDIAKKFYNEIDEYIYGSMVLAHQKILFQERKRIPPFVIHINDETIVKEGKVSNLLDFPINIATIYILDEQRSDFVKVLKKYEEHIAFREWGGHLGIRSFEIFSSKVSKGNASLFLKNYFNIEDNHTIAFGDDLNDLEMLEKVDIGVAMKNARKTVILRTNYITEYSNKNDGVIKYIISHLKKDK